MLKTESSNKTNKSAFDCKPRLRLKMNASSMQFAIAQTAVIQTIGLQKLAVLDLKNCFHLKNFGCIVKSHCNGQVYVMPVVCCIRISYVSSKAVIVINHCTTSLSS